MKILFDNLLDDATITSVNASPNYAVENLQDQFVEVRYQSALSSDTITITLNEISSINCIFYNYTNADTMEFKLYNSSDVLLYTKTISSVSDDISGYYFTTVENVSYITLYITETTAPYLGSLGFGQAKEMKNLANQDWSEPITDNTVITTSPEGSVLQNYVQPLDGYTFTFRDYTREEINEIKTLIKSIGIGKGVFIDITEDNHSFINTLFAYLIATISPVRNGRRYDFTLQIREAR